MVMVVRRWWRRSLLSKVQDQVRALLCQLPHRPPISTAVLRVLLVSFEEAHPGPAKQESVNRGFQTVVRDS